MFSVKPMTAMKLAAKLKLFVCFLLKISKL